MEIEAENFWDRRWELRRHDGPVFATAVHAGHALREEVTNQTALSADTRRREEDPMTDVLASVGDSVFVTRASRFEVDLNRPPEQAVYREPSDAWGLDLWRSSSLPQAIVERSMVAHTAFYREMARWIEHLIEINGRVLLLDVHAFNHRLERADVEPSDVLPDIDLGVTTLKHEHFGDLVERFASALRQVPVQGRVPDVRNNVRFPDGGYWPEWVFARYGENVCTVTLEYKKIFMDEWTGQADLAALEALRAGLAHATSVARQALHRRRAIQAVSA